MTKSLFLYVNWGPIWYGFCAGAIAICPRLNIAYIWGPQWHLLVAPFSVNHCLIFFFSFFNSAMKVDLLQEIEWLPEKSWDRNLIFFTMARKVNLLKLLLRKRKRKQIMQEKGDYVRKLLLLACKMWKMDQQIHVMFKNKSKEIIAFVNDPWTFSITTASLPNGTSQGVTDANLTPLWGASSFTIISMTTTTLFTESLLIIVWREKDFQNEIYQLWTILHQPLYDHCTSRMASCSLINSFDNCAWSHDQYFRNVDHCEDA